MTEKGQDYCCTGAGRDVDTGEPFRYIMVNDGHGTDSCIFFIRGISDSKKAELLGSRDPVEALAKHITDSGCVSRGESSGATLVLVKLYADRAVCLTCGDSKLVVFKDGALLHETVEHDGFNEEERARVTALGVTFEKSSNFRLLSENLMTAAPSLYCLFGDGNRLAPTQALGHNSKTGYKPSVYVVPYEADSSYRFVLGSDGLFDMIVKDCDADMDRLRCMSNAREIVDYYVARWQQRWGVLLGDGSRTSQKFNKRDCDDVVVAVVELAPHRP